MKNKEPNSKRFSQRQKRPQISSFFVSFFFILEGSVPWLYNGPNQILSKITTSQNCWTFWQNRNTSSGPITWQNLFILQFLLYCSKQILLSTHALINFFWSRSHLWRKNTQFHNRITTQGVKNPNKYRAQDASNYSNAELDPCWSCVFIVNFWMIHFKC